MKKAIYLTVEDIIEKKDNQVKINWKNYLMCSSEGDTSVCHKALLRGLSKNDILSYFEDNNYDVVNRKHNSEIPSAGFPLYFTKEKNALEYLSALNKFEIKNRPGIDHPDKYYIVHYKPILLKDIK